MCFNFYRTRADHYSVTFMNRKVLNLHYNFLPFFSVINNAVRNTSMHKPLSLQHRPLIFYLFLMKVQKSVYLSNITMNS